MGVQKICSYNLRYIIVCEYDEPLSDDGSYKYVRISDIHCKNYVPITLNKISRVQMATVIFSRKM